jgi:hypothetical protein
MQSRPRQTPNQQLRLPAVRAAGLRPLRQTLRRHLCDRQPLPIPLYTCLSRQRSSTRTCPTDRLPADELDTALLNTLLATYQRTDLLELAVQAVAARLDRVRDQHQDELNVVEAELRRTEEAIQRYRLAFEAGTLSDIHLAP